MSHQVIDRLKELNPQQSDDFLKLLLDQSEDLGIEAATLLRAEMNWIRLTPVEGLTTAQLKRALSWGRLDVSGTREELLNRLRNHRLKRDSSPKRTTFKEH